MANSPKKDTQPLGNDIPQMPFDEALKRVWAAKPQHKATKKTPKKKAENG
jgi:hypothetical protein